MYFYLTKCIRTKMIQYSIWQGVTLLTRHCSCLWVSHKNGRFTNCWLQTLMSETTVSTTMWNLTPLFSYQASKLSFRALMLASQKSQSPWRQGQGLGPKLRADSGSSRCRCTSQWCPPFPPPRRSRWGWRRPHSVTEGNKQRGFGGQLEQNIPASCNTVHQKRQPFYPLQPPNSQEWKKMTCSR